MTCNVKFIKPGDKEYPPYMSVLPNADKIEVLSVDGVFVVPLVQVIDALIAARSLKEIEK